MIPEITLFTGLIWALLGHRCANANLVNPIYTTPGVEMSGALYRKTVRVEGSQLDTRYLRADLGRGDGPFRPASVFELDPEQLMGEFLHWDVTRVSLRDFLWTHYRVHLIEDEEDVSAWRLFCRSIKRHVAMFFRQHLLEHPDAKRKFPVVSCADINMAHLVKIDDEKSRSGGHASVFYETVIYDAPGAHPSTENARTMYTVVKVFTGRSIKRNALKTPEAIKKRMKTVFERELSTLTRLTHPNIIDLICIDRDNHQMVFERAIGGDLTATNPLLRDKEASMLTDQRLMNPEETFLPRFARQLILAVRHVHEMDLIHMDLKGGNVVVFGPDSNFVHRWDSDEMRRYSAVLIDFGLCETSAHLAKRTCLASGTISMMAPEQRMCDLRQEAGTSIDWWGLGAVLFRTRIIWDPTIPYDESIRILNEKCETYGHSVMTVDQPFMSAEFKELLKKLLVTEPQNRDFDKNINELLDLPFVKKGE